ncbi:hypothetical protein BJV78DRAFT_639765 [Lactifluus subvellereus]|nr:hypothetical protein BJV78DRAFT_639765 [Lactifluus subvellereus]
MNLGHLRDLSVHSYLQVAGISFLYYDHILTFPAEVSHVWPQPFSANKLLFFVNRYVGFFGNITATMLVSGDLAGSRERSVLYWLSWS